MCTKFVLSVEWSLSNLYLLSFCIRLLSHQAIFASMDKNGDGKVQAEEFMEWFSTAETNEGIKSFFHQKTMQIFKEIDTDNSGYIDEQELVDVSVRLGQKFSQAEINAIFNEMDTNKNGKVEIKEFIQWMDKDASKSGFGKMLSSTLSLGGSAWLDQKESGGSFLG